MARKKEIRVGTHKLLLPKGSVSKIEDLVNRDEGYKDKTVWIVKHLSILHNLIVRAAQMKKEFVRASMRMESIRLKCSNNDTCKLYDNLQRLEFISVNKKGAILGKRSYSYKLNSSEIIEHEISRNSINITTDEILGGEMRKKSTNSKLTPEELKYLGVLQKISLSNEFETEFHEIVERNRKDRKERSIQQEPVTGIKETHIYPLRGGFVPEYMNLQERLAVQEIIDGKVCMTRPDKESRIYTNTTRFPKRLRPHLRLNHKPLIEIDIRNSQPLLASIIFRAYSEKVYGFIKDDVLDYQKQCEFGLFYDYFMELNNVPAHERDSFKKVFFATVFFSKEMMQDNILKTQFKERFPTCYEALFEVKGGRFYAKEFGRFAVWMQKIEASIIVRANYQLIAMGIDCFNIFDALYFSSTKDSIAGKKLLEELFSEVGLSPTMNVKCLVVCNSEKVK